MSSLLTPENRVSESKSTPEDRAKEPVERRSLVPNVREAKRRDKSFLVVDELRSVHLGKSEDFGKNTALYTYSSR